MPIIGIVVFKSKGQRLRSMSHAIKFRFGRKLGNTRTESRRKVKISTYR